MAYQSRNEREMVSRKNLAELQLNKMMLLKPGVISSLSSTAISPFSLPTNLPANIASVTQNMSSAHQMMSPAHQNMSSAHQKMSSARQKMSLAHQKMHSAHQKMSSAHQKMSPAQHALAHANAHSSGFFISQDSSYGNLILPVLPRFED